MYVYYVKLNQRMGMKMMGSTKLGNEEWKSHFLGGVENEILILSSDFLTPNKI